jgi:hypothetical protein
MSMFKVPVGAAMARVVGENVRYGSQASCQLKISTSKDESKELDLTHWRTSSLQLERQSVSDGKPEA